MRFQSFLLLAPFLLSSASAAPLPSANDSLTKRDSADYQINLYSDGSCGNFIGSFEGNGGPLTQTYENNYGNGGNIGSILLVTASQYLDSIAVDGVDIVSSSICPFTHSWEPRSTDIWACQPIGTFVNKIEYYIENCDSGNVGAYGHRE